MGDEQQNAAQPRASTGSDTMYIEEEGERD